MTTCFIFQSQTKSLSTRYRVPCQSLHYCPIVFKSPHTRIVLLRQDNIRPKFPKIKNSFISRTRWKTYSPWTKRWRRPPIIQPILICIVNTDGWITLKQASVTLRMLHSWITEHGYPQYEKHAMNKHICEPLPPFILPHYVYAQELQKLQDVSHTLSSIYRLEI